jgi:hypothetical protein
MLTVIISIVLGIAIFSIGIAVGMNYGYAVRSFICKLRRFAIKVGLFGGGTAAVIGLATFVAEYILK